MSLHNPGAQVAAVLAALLLVLPSRVFAADSAQVRLIDAELVDSNGAPARLSSQVIGDSIVVMDFVFTTCTTICPVLSAIFSRVQGKLGERLGKEVRLVSISLDPARDTPARLKAYSANHRAKPGWTWLTGTQEDVRQVLEGLGAYTPAVTQHTPMVLVGDPRTGKWVRLNGFPNEDQILAQVDALAKARQEAPASASEKKAREWFTDTLLVTQEGKQVRFYSDMLKDRVVVISFLFTRCTTACPLLTARLNRIREELGERFGQEVSFITLSVDSEYDTPERLMEFARRHKATHPGWTFLTGKREDVNQVITRLGQYVENIEDHSTLLIAGNEKQRHWIKLPPQASPTAVAERVRMLAEGP
ncbi:SCO family protein [Hyalangium minutum]|uniref:Cytochrome oxidase biogenesis protein Sco1/SenC/PrrC, putative copper metallochaperone n=1 Tax=Hyalangium minutum TaxID=394096 RepID=A0A085VYS2_9BACT|nr:SCO family protein [Hyalangium minutum]KFE60585.1 Cytochrome oxidase biogenesis protein Sco1/SenC/PrrC, putative copper metallochaperone [Hyalangium minutum]